MKEKYTQGEQIVEQTKEQVMEKITFYLSMLTDSELHMALGFVRGLSK